MYLSESDPTHTCSVAIVTNPIVDDDNTELIDNPITDSLEFVAETESSELLKSEAQQFIDHYQLIRCLGRGMAGSVWSARDLENPGRDVALKIMHADMHDEYMLARYTCEVRALARMNNPYIARIWSNGKTAEGKLYIAMELIPGTQLSTFCNTWSPTVRERVELIVKLCRGLQHAHHQGILHRDLKPANILVTHQDGIPCPKIIDFGLAKSFLKPLLPGSADTTQMGCLLGTIGYMSPEQASTGIRDIDTRSDVYSICAILYELLSGTLPVPREEINRASLAQALDMVQNREPDAVSHRLKSNPQAATHAARCQQTPLRLEATLRGDLDAILEKGLSKDRNKRYQSASELADDLERYLAGEIVQARPRTYWYLTQKLLSKHWKLALLISTISVMFLISWVAIAVGFYWAVEARNEAQQAEASLKLSQEQELKHKLDAEKSSMFLSDVLSYPRPLKLGQEVKLIDALDEAKARISKTFINQPRAEALVRLALASSYLQLGQPAQAQQLLESSLFRQALTFENDAEWRLQAETLYVRSLMDQDLIQQATERCHLVLQHAQRNGLTSKNPAVRSFYQISARLLCQQESYAEGIQLLRNALQELERESTRTASEVWGLRSVMVSCFTEWAKKDRSVIPQFQTLVNQYLNQVTQFPETHPIKLQLKCAFANMKHFQGRTDEALEILIELLEQAEEIYGPLHLHTLSVQSNMSQLLLDSQQYRRASAVLTSMLSAQTSLMGKSHELTQKTLSELVRISEIQKRFWHAWYFETELYQGRLVSYGNSHIKCKNSLEKANQLLLQAGCNWLFNLSFLP
ncbi:MAG: protein kinase [Planctomycetia bacterium]|nr:protein kinase [Planctomycetia bacterium]